MVWTLLLSSESSKRKISLWKLLTWFKFLEAWHLTWLTPKHLTENREDYKMGFAAGLGFFFLYFLKLLRFNPKSLNQCIHFYFLFLFLEIFIWTRINHEIYMIFFYLFVVWIGWSHLNFRVDCRPSSMEHVMCYTFLPALGGSLMFWYVDTLPL